jgi:transposase-like protein
MYCSTSLLFQPILPRLPRALAGLFIVSLLLYVSHTGLPSEPWWLPPPPVTRGRCSCHQVHVRRRSAWYSVHLLPRLLARCALLALLLHRSGWLRATPFSAGLVLVPILHGATLALAYRGSPGARRWAPRLQRLYQLLLLVLLIRTLQPMLHARSTPLTLCMALGTWRVCADPDHELVLTQLDEQHYQVCWDGELLLAWEARDSFERWLLILFLRRLSLCGARHPLLTQAQVGALFATDQSAVSRWEGEVRRHGWHVLSDRYRHQLHSVLPDPALSRQILALWVPAFWLSAWEVREQLIAKGIVAERAALSLESLHALAHHTGFAQVRQILLERFALQQGQLIAEEQWWLRELLALTTRLLDKLERGETLTPQELVDCTALRLPTPPAQLAPAPPPLAAALQSMLLAPPAPATGEPIPCPYCGSTDTAPKSKTPRFKTVVDLLGQLHRIPVLRRYCHNPACTHQTFTHFPPGVLPHSPHPLQARLLALEVYEALLSTYRRSARMLRVSAATLYRWTLSLSPAAAALAAYLGVVRTSGVIGVDDKWLKVCSPSAVPVHGRRPRAVWHYAYFAVDVYSYDLLALELYPQHNDHALHLFLLELKARGVRPRVIVTDLDPAYERVLPAVFPRAVHHECIFHALQNTSRQLTAAYGKHYAEKVPEAGALQQRIVHVFRPQAQKTVRARFAEVMALREAYVSRTPAVAPVFDSLAHHFPRLVNAIEHPLIPRTNNACELVIRRFDQHYQSMCGLDSFASARAYLRVFELVYRLTPFAADNKTRRIRGKCPLELAGYDLETLPLAEFFWHLKLPALGLPGEEVVPMT